MAANFPWGVGNGELRTNGIKKKYMEKPESNLGRYRKTFCDDRKNCVCS